MQPTSYATNPPVRIAVAGAGYIGQAHIGAILKNNSSTLSAIVDPSPNAKIYAANLQVPYFEDLDVLLKSNLTQQHTDAVIIATPNHLHAQQVLTCMRMNMPVLVEKPVTHDLASGQQLLEALTMSKAPVLVGHHRAHSAIMKNARAMVHSGQLGKIVSVVGTAWFFKPDDYFESSPWRKSKAAGPLLLNMIHEVHNLRMLCGEVTQVQAMTSQATRGFEVEDTASITMRFNSGVLASFAISDTAASPKSWEQTSQENPAYSSYPDQNCYYIAGTHASLAIPTMTIHSYTNTQQRSWWKPFQVSAQPAITDDPIANQIDHFVRVVRAEETPLVSLHDGLENLKVVQAIVVAASQGITVHMASFNQSSAIA